MNQVIALKRLARVSLGKMLQSEAKQVSDAERCYLRAANVQPDGELAITDAKTMWFSDQEVRDLDVLAGDVVVVEGGVGGFGRAAYVSEDLSGWGFQNSINRLRPCAGVDGRYLTYALLSLRSSGWIRAYCNIVSMPHLTADKLRELRVPAADSGWQKLVANYLDRETARIDELIAEQEAMRLALTERRRGLITVLTDDPRFTVVPLGRLLDGIRQGWSPNCEAVPADGINEWGVLKTGCVNAGVFRPGENKRLPDDEPPRIEHAVRPGEVVVSRASTGELVGSAALMPDGYPRLLLSDLTYGLTLRPGARPDYVVYALAGIRARAQVTSMAKGTSASMQKVSQRDVKEISVRMPSEVDQGRIVVRLDAETAHVDELMGECRALITLLKERRSALITAAVTGQIDVRGD